MGGGRGWSGCLRLLGWIERVLSTFECALRKPPLSPAPKNRAGQRLFNFNHASLESERSFWRHFSAGHLFYRGSHRGFVAVGSDAGGGFFSFVRLSLHREQRLARRSAGKI